MAEHRSGSRLACASTVQKVQYAVAPGRGGELCWLHSLFVSQALHATVCKTVFLRLGQLVNITNRISQPPSWGSYDDAAAAASPFCKAIGGWPSQPLTLEHGRDWFLSNAKQQGSIPTASYGLSLAAKRMCRNGIATSPHRCDRRQLCHGSPSLTLACGKRSTCVVARVS